MRIAPLAPAQISPPPCRFSFFLFSVLSANSVFSVLILFLRSNAAQANYAFARSLQGRRMDSPPPACQPLPAAIDHSRCRRTRNIVQGRAAALPRVASPRAPLLPQILLRPKSVQSTCHQFLPAAWRKRESLP